MHATPRVSLVAVKFKVISPPTTRREGGFNAQLLFARWQKGKMLLLCSLSCWIIFTLPLGFIQPPVTSCIKHKNVTEWVLQTPDLTSRMLKREAPMSLFLLEEAVSTEPRACPGGPRSANYTIIIIMRGMTLLHVSHRA